MASDDLELGMLSSSKLKINRFLVGAYDIHDNISALDNENKIVDVILRARLEISDADCHIELAETGVEIHLGPLGQTYIDNLEIKKADLRGREECACTLVLEVVDPPALKCATACRLPFTFCQSSNWTAEIPKIVCDITNTKKQLKKIEIGLVEMDKNIEITSARILNLKSDIVDGKPGTVEDRISLLPAELEALDSSIAQKEAAHAAMDLRAKLKAAVPFAREGLIGVAAELAKIDADSEHVNSIQSSLSAHLGPKMNALLFRKDSDLNEFQDRVRTKQQEPQRRLGYSSQRVFDIEIRGPPKETSGYLGQADAFLSINGEAKRFMKALVGNLAVFSTYDSAQAYSQQLRRRGVCLVGLDQPKRIIRSDGGEYSE